MYRGGEAILYYHWTGYVGGAQGVVLPQEVLIGIHIGFLTDLELSLIRPIGSSEITIEVVGPADQEQSISREKRCYLAPNELHEMACRVMRQCIDGSTNAGGYVTRNISHAIDFLTTTYMPAET